METGARLTSLLPNDLIRRVERLRVNPRRRLTDRRRGEHLAGKSGSSTDFSDYRDYVPGDDVKFVDWNVFARLQRPYLKLYLEEEEMHVAILVDASGSMAFEEKIERAKELAAVFGIMGLLNRERVSVGILGRAAPGARLSPATGRAGMGPLFRFLEAIGAGGDVPPDEGIEAFLTRHTGRGIAVVLSDFLTFGDLGRTFNRLFGAGLEVFALQILGPAEIDPGLGGDLRLVDGETGGTLDVSAAGGLLDIYREHRADFSRTLETLARRRSGRFLSLSAAEPLPGIVFDRLLRRGWMR